MYMRKLDLSLHLASNFAPFGSYMCLAMASVTPVRCSFQPGHVASNRLLTFVSSDGSLPLLLDLHATSCICYKVGRSIDAAVGNKVSQITNQNTFDAWKMICCIVPVELGEENVYCILLPINPKMSFLVYIEHSFSTS